MSGSTAAAGPAARPPGRKLLSGIATLMVGMGLERFLGYLRDAGLAAAFGLTATLDAFNMALSIPLLLYSLFPGPGGARFSGLLTPLYTEYRERGNREAGERLVQTVLSLFLLLLFLMAAVLLFAPGIVVKLFAPGFPAATAALTARGLRLLAAVLLFWGVAGFLRAYLMAHERFGVPTVAHLVSNLVLVIYVFLAAVRFGVEGMAVAVVLAGLILLLIHVVGLRGTAFRPGFRIDWRHPGLGRFVKLLPPVVFVLGVSQLNALVSQIMASGLDEGSVSALTYANRIRALPLELFVMGIHQATFPRLCAEYTRRGLDGVRDVLLFTIRISAVATFPAVVGIIVLRGPIADLAFGHGAVGEGGSHLIAGALACYILGLAPLAVGGPLANAFLAMQDTKTPSIVSAVSLGVNIVMNLILVRFLGIYGLALGTSIAALVYTVQTAVVLSRRIGGIRAREIWDACGRSLAASAIMGGACWFLYSLLARIFPVHHVLGLSAALGLTVAAGIAVYAGAAWALRVRGIGLAWEMVRERLQRRPRA